MACSGLLTGVFEDLPVSILGLIYILRTGSSELGTLQLATIAMSFLMVRVHVHACLRMPACALKCVRGRRFP